MSLTSLKFLAFTAAVVALTRLFAPSRRWAILLGACAVFCAAAGPSSAALVAAVSLANFICGIALENSPPGRRPLWLWGGIALNAATLCLFKYALAGSWAMPVGMSIYIFQAISYLVDIDLGAIPAERHLGHFLLYLSYFPKLLQGPLERARDFLPQLKDGLREQLPPLRGALPLIILGLFKKIIVADPLGEIADAVFNHIPSHHGLGLLLGVYAFAFQIYFDFAGYTDIARGLSRLFGLELSPNFDSPYLASNIQDFWRRWHMTLSSWLRDYLFMPLAAGLRGFEKGGGVAAALLTFMICGMWHGAGWGYFVFGALHGLFIAASLLTLKSRDRLVTRLGLNPTLILWWRRAVTFHLAAFAFIFFRCSTLGAALDLLARLPGPADLSPLLSQLAPMRAAALGLGLALLAAPNLIETASERCPALFYAFLTDMIFLFAAKSNAPFIYNKF